jgi:hypothetical protein
MIYNQTMQLIIFYLYLILHTCVQRFDVMEKEYKNLEFRRHLNEALVQISDACTMILEL